ncbi:putative glutamine amidotransferase [Rubrobacter radiotolerans]|uniref:Gamma-glutamyl-gamma-aminobutyrate hydrolase family protein n=1 Tax=Rubrobacter radiotolerans TaxID=42256 RepID=A0A023X4V8_RUBRA|nr:gamma-glutamyl-gamma-aminobutyrate hydrolase family protein [Rubrobacter radiotolerans]AHY47025.1 putative glutamine amidotransferase [Rubrobacter radiotolerans]MDX5894431.1 gamma-glutamyl-gamma-aminobutyrate hydrolase family protein [Rubrobacter radiotolerans]SMC05988.1 putative glutamine amidotransferase [Rubrobacter radiotolerans DSM 5868]
MNETFPPTIGVTATLKEDTETVATRPLGRYVRNDLDYIEGVAEAGGIPIILPPVMGAGGPEGYARSVIGRLDGLLLSGGSDLDPSYYGEESLPELDVTVPERDMFEMALLELALERGIPVFGICRGMQILNVALGGTLYQDLPSQRHPDDGSHRQTDHKWEPRHEVVLEPGAWSSSLLVPEVGNSGWSTPVNSYHHQAIKDLAGGLRATGHAPDGIVEVVESRDFSEGWFLGVQWHAEAMRSVRPEHASLFRAHVEAASGYARGRVAA